MLDNVANYFLSPIRITKYKMYNRYLTIKYKIYNKFKFQKFFLIGY